MKNVVLKRFSMRPASSSAATHPSWLSLTRRSEVGRAAVDVALDEHVDVVVGRDPDALGPADEPGVGEHAFAQHVARAGAHDAVQGALGLASVHVREHVPHRLLDQSGIVRGRQRLRIPILPDAEHLRIVGDLELDEGLLERGVPVADDADEQRRQGGDRERNRNHSVRPETPFRRAPLRNPPGHRIAGVNARVHRPPCQVWSPGVSRTARGTCAPLATR